MIDPISTPSPMGYNDMKNLVHDLIARVNLITKLRAVQVDNGVAKFNFSKEIATLDVPIMTSEINDLISQIDQLNNELFEKNEDLEELENQNQDLENQNQNLENQNQNLQNQNQDLQDLIDGASSGCASGQFVIPGSFSGTINFEWCAALRAGSSTIVDVQYSMIMRGDYRSGSCTIGSGNTRINIERMLEDRSAFTTSQDIVVPMVRANDPSAGCPSGEDGVRTASGTRSVTVTAGTKFLILKSLSANSYAGSIRIRA